MMSSVVGTIVLYFAPHLSELIVLSKCLFVDLKQVSERKEEN